MPTDPTFACKISLGQNINPSFQMATKNNETSMVQVCSCSFPYSYTVPYPDCSITSKLFSNIASFNQFIAISTQFQHLQRSSIFYQRTHTLHAHTKYCFPFSYDLGINTLQTDAAGCTDYSVAAGFAAVYSAANIDYVSLNNMFVSFLIHHT